MGRIIFLNRFYWPYTPATGQLLTDLATELAKDFRVTVITSGDSSQPRRETDRDVEIVRVRSPRDSRGSIVSKATAFIGFAFGATWQLLSKTRRNDIIVVMTDPPLLGVVAWLIARMRAAQVIHWVQDIYPEVAIAVTGHRWLSVLSPVRNTAWRGASACVGLSDEMAGVIANAGVVPSRIHTIPNWAPSGLYDLPADDPSVTALRRQWQVDGKFVVAYSGNLGRVHDLGPILEAAALLREEPGIEFLFIGGGAQRRALEAESIRRKLTNVRFLPPQPRQHLGPTLAVADIHLVTLRPGCERYVFPSKLYGIAAVGKPVLFVGPPKCELARLVVQHGLGRAVDRDDPTQLAAVIRELATDSSILASYGTRALRFAGPPHTRHSIESWHELISTMAGSLPQATANV
jgi:colanic acid biosynthesis glycosyl transferase WcaI